MPRDEKLIDDVVEKVNLQVLVLPVADVFELIDKFLTIKYNYGTIVAIPTANVNDSLILLQI